MKEQYVLIFYFCLFFCFFQFYASIADFGIDLLCNETEEYMWECYLKHTVAASI